MMPEPQFISVFTDSSDSACGGNPCAVILDASTLSNEAMQAMAKRYGHETTFVLPPPPGLDVDYELRFFVPEQEIEMCGHGTVGTTWLLNDIGRVGNDKQKSVAYLTKSGVVRARIADSKSGEAMAEVQQPRGWVRPLADADVRRQVTDVLRINEEDLHPTLPIQNACASRVKTIIPLRNSESLSSLRPDFPRLRALCEELGSTGLYPYVLHQDSEGNQEARHDYLSIEARQFPKANGFPEDPATGVAAAALIWAMMDTGVLDNDGTIIVKQGVAMGKPSEIHVRVESDVCWVGGYTRRMDNWGP